MLKKGLPLVAVASLAFVIVGCPEKKEGKLEKLGAKADKELDKAEDALENAEEDVEEALDGDG